MPYSYTLTKSDFKYGCSLGVFATPAVFVNGAAVTASSGDDHPEGVFVSMSVSDWRAVLAPIAAPVGAR